jgi:hypothetical protein
MGNPHNGERLIILFLYHKPNFNNVSAACLWEDLNVNISKSRTTFALKLSETLIKMEGRFILKLATHIYGYCSFQPGLFCLNKNNDIYLSCTYVCMYVYNHYKNQPVNAV